MVEGVVKVGAYLQPRRLRKLEELPNPEVYTPRARSGKNVSFGHVRIVEGISPDGRRQKCSRIEEPITDFNVLACARYYDGSKACAIEPADCVDEVACDITRENRVTVVTSPKGREAGTAFREHIPGELKAAESSVSPLRKVVPKLPALAPRQFVNTVTDEAMARNKRVTCEVVIGIGWVVGSAT